MDYSRRRFLRTSAGVAVMPAALGCAAAEPEGVEPDQTPQVSPVELGPGRIALAEPGPMVPPVPAVLLTVRGEEGDPDEISVLWTFVVNGDPPQIGVAAGFEHIARGLLETHSEFVLNVPSASMMESFDTVDMNSSRVGDKYALSGLTRGVATEVDAPTIMEAPIQCECRTIAMLEVPPVRKLFIAEVVATTVLEGAVDENGRLLVDRVPFFGMTAGSGEHYTMGRRIGNIGMTVGRDDIKY